MKIKKIKKELSSYDSIIGKSGVDIGFISNIRAINIRLEKGQSANIGIPTMLFICQDLYQSHEAILCFAQYDMIYNIAGPNNLVGISIISSVSGVIIKNNKPILADLKLMILSLNPNAIAIH